MELAAAAGLRTLFVGFETLSGSNLRGVRKVQNLDRDYAQAVRRLHNLGVMVHGSFVFGLDGDDESVFDRTVEWALDNGLEAATFHILTPYPGTVLHDRLQAQGRIVTSDWRRYDTRHVVFRPARMSSEALERGYWRAYESFYSWGSILRAARTKPSAWEALRHAAYAAGWKKAEPIWNLIIRAGLLGRMAPVMEAILGGFDRDAGDRRAAHAGLRATAEARASASNA
jgi:radical SAM superfamily enzyme YgiQ (UPF0313 family)